MGLGELIWIDPQNCYSFPALLFSIVQCPEFYIIAIHTSYMK